MEERRTRSQCNHCGRETFHHRLFEKTVWGFFQELQDDDIDHPDNADWTEEYELLQCLGCDETCVKVKKWNCDMPPDYGPETHIYPPRLFRPRPKWFSGLPNDLQCVLDEVYAALAIDSRRLAVMGVRTVIEGLLSEKVGVKGGWAERLDELERQGFIGRADREHLGAVVEAGHAAAHRGHAPSSEDLTHVMDILENILLSAYRLSEAARTVRNNTPRRFPRRI